MTVCGLETLKHFLNILPHKNIMVRGENFHALSVIFANQVFIAVHMCVHFHICLFTSTSIFALFKQCFTLKTFHLLHILQYTQFQQTFIFPLPICSPLDALRLLAVRAKLSMLSMREYLVFTSGLPTFAFFRLPCTLTFQNSRKILQLFQVTYLSFLSLYKGR